MSTKSGAVAPIEKTGVVPLLVQVLVWDYDHQVAAWSDQTPPLLKGLGNSVHVLQTVRAIYAVINAQGTQGSDLGRVTMFDIKGLGMRYDRVSPTAYVYHPSTAVSQQKLFASDEICLAALFGHHEPSFGC